MRVLRRVSALAFLLALIIISPYGCGGSDDNSSVNGRAVKGPIVGGTVSVYAINTDGSRGELLETTSTDDSGNFSIDAYTQPIEVAVSGGTFVDEATGQTVEMGSAEIIALLPDGVSDGEEVAVTLLTHIAAADARARIANGEEPLSAMRTANEEVATTFGLQGIDITKTAPSDLTNPDECATAGNATSYAGAMASLSWYGMENGAHPLELLALAECIGIDHADGRVDGDACNGTTLNPSIAVNDREDNANDFLNSGQNQSCAGADDVTLDTKGGGSGGGNGKPKSDTTPDPFTFVDQTGAPLTTLTTSNGVVISGISKPVIVTISGDPSCQYSIDGGAYSNTTGTAVQGTAITLQLTSSGTDLTPLTCTLTVGSGSATWSVTTGDFTGPVVTVAPSTGNEGSPTTIPVTATETVTNVMVDYGDATTAGPFTWTAGTTNLTHTYVDNGAYTVTITGDDSVGNPGGGTGTATVNNVAPTFTGTGNQAHNTSANPWSYNPTLIITDPGTADTHTCAWTYDGAPQGVCGGTAASPVFSVASPTAGIHPIVVTITDNDLGTGTQTFTLAVTDNVPPAITVTGNTVNEGAAASASVNSSEACTASITWGDGNTVNNVAIVVGANTVNHPSSYVDEGVGIYTVTVTCVDVATNTGIGTGTMTVNNVAPTFTGTANQTTTLSAGTWSYNPTLIITDPGTADTHTCAWTYDGVPQSVCGGTAASPIFGVGSPTVGVHTIVVTITDNDGGAGNQSFTLTVNDDIPPLISITGATGNEGSALTATLTTGEACTGAITWGDASSSTGLTVTVAGPNNFTHTYVDEGTGTYTIGFTCDDGLGNIGSNTGTMTVNNVAPTVGAIGNTSYGKSTLPQTYNPGALAITDQGTADTVASCAWTLNAISQDACDGGPSPNFTFTVPNTFTIGGPYSAVVTITDDDGGTGTQTFTVTVTDDIAPIVTQFADAGTVTNTTWDANVTLSESGTGYCGAVATGGGAPTAAILKAGTGGGLLGTVGTVAMASTTPTSCQVTGLTASTTYDFYFFGEDPSGNPSTVSGPLTQTTTTPPTPCATGPTIYSSLAAWQAASLITGTVMPPPAEGSAGTSATVYTTGSGNNTIKVNQNHTNWIPNVTWIPTSMTSHTMEIRPGTTATITFTASETAFFFAFESWDTINPHDITVSTNGAAAPLTQTQSIQSTVYFGICEATGFTTVTINCPTCTAAGGGDGLGIGDFTD